MFVSEILQRCYNDTAVPEVNSPQMASPLEFPAVYAEVPSDYLNLQVNDYQALLDGRYGILCPPELLCPSSEMIRREFFTGLAVRFAEHRRQMLQEAELPRADLRRLVEVLSTPTQLRAERANPRSLLNQFLRQILNESGSFSQSGYFYEVNDSGIQFKFGNEGLNAAAAPASTRITFAQLRQVLQTKLDEHELRPHRLRMGVGMLGIHVLQPHHTANAVLPSVDLAYEDPETISIRARFAYFPDNVFASIGVTRPIPFSRHLSFIPYFGLCYGNFATTAFDGIPGRDTRYDRTGVMGLDASASFLLSVNRYLGIYAELGGTAWIPMLSAYGTFGVQGMIPFGN